MPGWDRRPPRSRRRVLQIRNHPEHAELVALDEVDRPAAEIVAAGGQPPVGRTGIVPKHGPQQPLELSRVGARQMRKSGGASRRGRHRRREHGGHGRRRRPGGRPPCGGSSRQQSWATPRPERPPARQTAAGRPDSRTSHGALVSISCRAKISPPVRRQLRQNATSSDRYSPSHNPSGQKSKPPAIPGCWSGFALSYRPSVPPIHRSGNAVITRSETRSLGEPEAGAAPVHRQEHAPHFERGVLDPTDVEPRRRSLILGACALTTHCCQPPVIY